MKICVIGAGPAGLTAAYILTKNNYKVDVYETDSSVGGLSKTIQLWEQKVDLGPHRFFCNNKQVNSLWLEVVCNNYKVVNRLTRIFYKNKFFYYPLNISNVFNTLGFYESFICTSSYLKEKIFPSKQNETFQWWVQNKFGKRLFEIFFKTYTEKLWGIPCNELHSDFATQRIKKLSFSEAIKNAMTKGKNNKHKTLAQQFAYPVGGSGMVYERMAGFITNMGNKVHLNTPVYRVITNKHKVYGIELLNGEFREYDYVISTMPFTSLVNTLLEVPEYIKECSQKLKYRNTIIVYLLVDSKDIFPDQWIYVHSPELKTGRITNFRNWVESLYGNSNKTILAIEYWCNSEDEIWKSSDIEIIKLAREEIEKTKLVKQKTIIDGFVYRIKKSYPVYHKDYKKWLKPMEDYIHSVEGICAIGRSGAFKYNNQDHSILMGIMAAENIINNNKINLFDINNNYEYQESYKIDETGLI